MLPYYQPVCTKLNGAGIYSHAGRTAVSVTSDLTFNHSDLTIHLLFHIHIGLYLVCEVIVRFREKKFLFS